jgi:hypothetical protein
MGVSLFIANDGKLVDRILEEQNQILAEETKSRV